MIADLKPYPAMKDSGVPWLGDVPAHWEVLPARAVYRPKLVKNIGLIEKTVLSLSYGRIVVKPPEKLRGLIPESFETYQIVDPGDIIIRTTDLQNDRTSLRIGYSQYRGIITAAYMCLKAKNAVSSEFGYQFLNAYDLLKIIYGFGSGLRQNLDFNHIKRMPVLVPPLLEQSAMIRFLDHMERRIRRAIRAKQKLIALLNEQKQAIIHRAVTRGLDPNVRLKPSGVEWLGDVPEHWEVKRFKFLARIASGQVDPRKPDYKRKILVAPNHIKVGSGMIAEFETAEAQGADSGKYEVRKGQIIYSKIRPNLRKAAIAPFDCLCSADMYPISVREAELRPAYFLLLLLSVPFTRYAVDCSLRVAMPKVNREALNESWLWYPNLGAQDGILHFVEQASEPTNVAVAAAEQEISLLREYRTRLISDVVTGKLDVRVVAARLPDETEEPELLDEIDALEEDEDETAEVDPDTALEEATA